MAQILLNRLQYFKTLILRKVHRPYIPINPIVAQCIMSTTCLSYNLQTC